MPRPSSTAATMDAKLSSSRTMSALSFATSVPVMPIATPRSDLLRAGASFTPSPAPHEASRARRLREGEKFRQALGRHTGVERRHLLALRGEGNLRDSGPLRTQGVRIEAGTGRCDGEGPLRGVAVDRPARPFLPEDCVVAQEAADEQVPKVRVVLKTDRLAVHPDPAGRIEALPAPLVPRLPDEDRPDVHLALRQGARLV